MEGWKHVSEACESLGKGHLKSTFARLVESVTEEDGYGRKGDASSGSGSGSGSKERTKELEEEEERMKGWAADLEGVKPPGERKVDILSRFGGRDRSAMVRSL